MRPRERHLRALTAVLTAAVLCLASGCAGSDVPASGTSTAALPSTVNDAPAQQDPGQFASFIGQEARVDQSDYEDDDYFIMQPGGTLTWFSYIIGGHRYEQHDDATWAADGNQVIFTFPSGAKMTGTLDGDTLSGSETNQDGTKYTWTAKPGTRPDPVP